MSVREDARRAWRARVNEAAREWGVVEPPFYHWRDEVAREKLFAALSAPKPWRTGGKTDPRRRYSRAHRRACERCRIAGWARSNGYEFAWMSEWFRLDITVSREHRVRVYACDPHGRRKGEM